MDKKDKDLSTTAAIENKAAAPTSRRSFLSKAIIAGVAVTATAGIAKKTSEVLLREDFQKAYLKDVLGGDGVLASRQYVLMSKQEKAELLKRLFQFHKNPEA